MSKSVERRLAAQRRPSDPRQEFVEAMRHIRARADLQYAAGNHEGGAQLEYNARRACIAFADALHPDITSSGPIMAALSGEKLRKKERAALLREVGLEECDGD